MTFVTTHRWGEAQADVWYLNKGEMLNRHRHPFSHSTKVSQGRTRVTLFLDQPERVEMWTMDVNSPSYAFEPDIEHEIESLEDGTIVVNMSTARPRPPAVTAKSGGLMMDTGEVIHDS
jgi:hypothetical protein